MTQLHGLAAWVKEEEKVPENRRRKRETYDYVDKVLVAPGVTV